MWNKHIFNPKWVSKYLLPKEKLKIEIPQHFIDGPPRITSKKIRFTVLDLKLALSPLFTDNDTLSLVQEIAFKIADYLPHTPVDAL